MSRASTSPARSFPSTTARSSGRPCGGDDRPPGRRSPAREALGRTGRPSEREGERDHEQVRQRTGGPGVIPLSLERIAEITRGTILGAPPEATITGPVVIDSRAAGPGALFVAVRGERVDGHDFA